MLFRLRYGSKTGEPNIRENSKSKNSSSNSNSTNQIETEGEIENEIDTHLTREVEEREMALQEMATTLLIQTTTTLHPTQTVF